MYRKSCWKARPCSPATFFIQILLIFWKFKLLYKQYSVRPRGPNLAILVFSICSFHLWHSLSYSPQYRFFKERFYHVTLAAKSLFNCNWAVAVVVVVWGWMGVRKINKRSRGGGGRWTNSAFANGGHYIIISPLKLIFQPPLLMIIAQSLIFFKFVHPCLRLYLLCYFTSLKCVGLFLLCFTQFFNSSYCYNFNKSFKKLIGLVITN